MHSIHRCLSLSRCCALIRLLTLRWLGLFSDTRLRATLSSIWSLLLALWPCLPWLPIVDKTVQGGLIGCKHCSVLGLAVLCLSWLRRGSLLGLRESRQAKQDVKTRAA